MADALSRRYNFIATLHVFVPGFTSFADLYPSDPSFGPIWTDLQKGQHTDYVVIDGFLFRDSRLCLPECSLRLQVITELHKECHVGRNRTLKLITTLYF